MNAVFNQISLANVHAIRQESIVTLVTAKVFVEFGTSCNHTHRVEVVAKREIIRESIYARIDPRQLLFGNVEIVIQESFHEFISGSFTAWLMKVVEEWFITASPTVTSEEGRVTH
mmetsp:Transcript_8248/g.23283  ORF Transcript_8248/g.23283 Transcript_8248/m.23283 type:complete len:115 (+) Transcript_8248:171-515(+)